MGIHILVVNCGSSSVKFGIFEVSRPESSLVPGEGADFAQALVSGSVTGLGSAGVLVYRYKDRPVQRLQKAIGSAGDAVSWILDLLAQPHIPDVAPLTLVHGVGHRVVHGGTRYTQPTLITDQVLQDIADLSALAPLHNPISLEGIRATRAALGSSLPMVAVFDTSFHHTLPPRAHLYALPRDLMRRHGIRRYGFHGIAHASLAEGYARLTKCSLPDRRLITLQLGNGCSITAQLSGQAIETSMGFTPLEGLIMGTRAGDLDPSIVSFLVEREGVPASEVERWLNERSGLLGISGRSHDMSTLLEAAAHDADAELAVEMFCYRILKYIGAYLAVLGGADAVIFGGGIGEKAPLIRQRVCLDLQWCGVRLDSRVNAAVTHIDPGEGICITRQDSALPVYVVGTAEEHRIARDTAFCL